MRIIMTDKLPQISRRPDVCLISALVLGSVVLAVSFLGENLYRDVAYCYAYAVREAALYGNWDYVLDPGLPVLCMISAVPFALCGLEASRALMLTCGLFWIATVFPLYFLLKRFISPAAASVGTVLFILAPKLIRFSCAGLVEAPRNFFLVSAFVTLFELTECGKLRNVFFFALSLAGLATARAEGFVISGVFLLLLFGNRIWLMRNSFSPRKLFRPFLLCCAAAGFFLLLLSPKLIYNYKKTGYPTIDTRYNPYLNALVRFDRFAILPADYPPPRPVTESSAAYRNSTSFPWKENSKAAFTNTVRGAYELYFIPGLLGLLCCIFRFSRPFKSTRQKVPEIVRNGWRMEYTDALIIVFFHEILYFTDCSAYRYYTFLIPLMLPFTMLAFSWLWNAAAVVPARFRPRMWLVLAGCVLAGMQLRNGLGFFFSAGYERRAGSFLRVHSRDFRKGRTGRTRIYVGYPEVAYYSGFEYANSSLNSKSRKLTARENEFDLAVFEKESDKWKEFAQEHGLVEWTGHPHSKIMRILIPERKAGVLP